LVKDNTTEYRNTGVQMRKVQLLFIQ